MLKVNSENTRATSSSDSIYFCRMPCSTCCFVEKLVVDFLSLSDDSVNLTETVSVQKVDMNWDFVAILFPLTHCSVKYP